MRLLSLTTLAFLRACSSASADETKPSPPAPSAVEVAAPSLSASATPSATSIATKTSEPTSPGCGENMARVEGEYCITAQEVCLERQKIPSGDRGMVENQCIRYAEPTRCYDDRRKHLSFCMDRFEWPNQRGEIPRTLVSWQTARATCESEGKRLCTEEEFNFACEGEAARPYVYGFARDASKCNFDRPYRPRTFTFTEWASCQSDAACKAAFDAIDQRVPAGSMETCRSPEGVYDLNGNVNEWVIVPGARSPHRSGLKGGWWGPVRDRCRPTVRFHDEGDFGYEVGFRCCADPAKP